MLVMVVFFIALMCIHLSMPLLRFVLLVLILLLLPTLNFLPFFFSSRRRHTRYIGDWSSDVCSSDLARLQATANFRRRCSATFGSFKIDSDPSRMNSRSSRLGAHCTSLAAPRRRLSSSPVQRKLRVLSLIIRDRKSVV